MVQHAQRPQSFNQLNLSMSDMMKFFVAIKHIFRNALIAVDPTTGRREIIIDDSILTGFPVDADVDIDHNRVLVLSNWTRDELLAFDLASDELTEIFSLFPVSADQIARDSLNNRMLLLQRPLIYINAIDLETGEVSEAF